MDETLILAIVSVGTMGILAAVAVFRASGDAREAFREGGKVAVRNTIGNASVTSAIENRANYLPESIRKVLTDIVDVYNPVSDKTEGDLDNKTQQWLKNILDNDPNTGAVN